MEPAAETPKPLGEDEGGTGGGEFRAEDVFQDPGFQWVPTGQENFRGKVQMIHTIPVQDLIYRRRPGRLNKGLQGLPVNPVVILLHEHAPVEDLPDADLRAGEMGSGVPQQEQGIEIRGREKDLLAVDIDSLKTLRSKFLQALPRPCWTGAHQHSRNCGGARTAGLQNGMSYDAPGTSSGFA